MCVGLMTYVAGDLVIYRFTGPKIALMTKHREIFNLRRTGKNSYLFSAFKFTRLCASVIMMDAHNHPIK